MLPVGLPRRILGQLWRRILFHSHEIYPTYSDTQRASLPPTAFSKPILLLSSHGSKTIWKEETTPEACIASYLEKIETLFDTNYFTSECYVDFAIEDTPNKDGVTLLWKTSCLEHQFKKIDEYFSRKKERRRCRKERFPWALTRDASGIQYIFTSGSSPYQRGVCQVKAYQVHKEIFSGLPKGFVSFGNKSIESLGMYQQETLPRITKNKKITTGRASTDQGKRNIELTSNRLIVGLGSNAKKAYGVRQEYRIRLDVLKQWLETKLTNINTADTGAIFLAPDNDSKYFINLTQSCNTKPNQMI
jgi:hypothetical protein